MDSDEENHTDRSTESDNKAKLLKFPTPKFVFTISSPCIVTVNRNDASPDMKDFTIRGALLRASQNQSTASTNCSSSTTSVCKKPLKIKMSSLIIKMVNTMVEREMIAFEAVQILNSAGNIVR
jgi:hypothetical protein